MNRDELLTKPLWGDAPEWAEWLAQDRDGSWCWYEQPPRRYVDSWSLGGCHAKFARKGAVPEGHDWRQTLEQRPILDETSEPKAVEWDGEGLPPVGSRHTDGDGNLVEIVAHRLVHAVCYLVDYADHQYVDVEYVDLRPIHSEEDRVVDEMIQDANIYDASYNKSVCRALYRAGYRKQEDV